MLYDYVAALIALQRTRDLARSALPDAPVNSDLRRHETGLLDHYQQVQREEQAFTEAHRWTGRAHRHASWALWSAGIGVLLAAIALVTG